MTVVCSMASFGSSGQVPPWRDLPEVYGPAPPVTIAPFGGGGLASGTRSWDALAAGHDAAVQMIDTSVVRVHQHGACGRGQQSPRHRSLARRPDEQDSRGRGHQWPAGSISPSRPARRMIPAVLSSPQRVASPNDVARRSWLRRGLDQGACSPTGAWANIPPKQNRKDPICFSPYRYRARNLIERFFNKIKQCRRVATRYDKLAANYLAFVKLASIRVWLRANKSSPSWLISEASTSTDHTGGGLIGAKLSSGDSRGAARHTAIPSRS